MALPPAELIRICRQLDVDAAMKAGPLHATPTGGYNLRGEYHDARTIVLASLHKVRVAQRSVYSKAERQASMTWLQENGYTPS